jgi:hypothetical protein
MGETSTHRPGARHLAAVHVRRKLADGRTPAMDIFVFADCSAITVTLDDRVEWFPSLGVLLAAYGLEWRDVELVPSTSRSPSRAAASVERS